MANNDYRDLIQYSIAHWTLTGNDVWKRIFWIVLNFRLIYRQKYITFFFIIPQYRYANVIEKVEYRCTLFSKSIFPHWHCFRNCWSIVTRSKNKTGNYKNIYFYISGLTNCLLFTVVMVWKLEKYKLQFW